ncbi:hypothetical protein SAMN05518847_10164 [Paenibacillus sp. OV219]|nr:hypothetical protein SAMN05518847_10164 [Paenibacillus sp. OV219]
MNNNEALLIWGAFFVAYEVDRLTVLFIISQE